MRTQKAAWAPFILFALACGGPAAPAASPGAPSEAPSEPTDGKAPSSAAGDEAPSKSDAAEAADKSASSAPASDDDVTAILQLVVDDPELDVYLHTGDPGRFPLKLSGDKLPSGLKLVKATKPVEIVDGPKSKKDPVLAITEIDVQGDKATVRYRYDIEGIRGTVTLARAPHSKGVGATTDTAHWELKNSRVVEH
jgi:hypothetical protein